MLLNLFVKFIVGGGVVALVSLLSEKGLSHYAGIIMTFPIITLISFMYVPEQQIDSLGRSGLIGLGLAFIFVFSCIILHQNGVTKPFSILISLLIWIAVTCIIFSVFQRG